MKHSFGSPILDAAVRLLTPYILLFALYVLFHGHHGPGGGFQGGTILAAGVILIRLVRGRRPGWGLSRRQAAWLAAAGVLIFAGIGFLGIFFGGAFLDYGVLPISTEIAQRRSLGILGIEIGVAIAVMGTMVLIFDALTDKQVAKK